jgi:hypothetical protein
MPTIEAAPSVSSLSDEAVRTNADTESPMSRGDDPFHKWHALIDYKLVDWAFEPGQFDEEGIEPPTRQVIVKAIELAKRLQDMGLAPPDFVVPDPNGGIVFERRENGVSEVFHVWEDGTVEYQRFQGAHLVERWAL